MFQNACSLYAEYLCRILGVLPDNSIAEMGAGCLLASDRVITVRHLGSDTARAGGQVHIRKADGSFASRRVWEDADSDLAVYQTTTCLASSGQAVPTRFPKLACILPAQGMILGYMATLRKSGDVITNNKYFSTGFVSYVNYSKSSLAHRYVLSGGYTDGGFSGGPVFLPNQSLIGILVSANQFCTEGLAINITCAFPELVGVARLASKIEAALTTSVRLNPG
jgi:hypothetical protein